MPVESDLLGHELVHRHELDRGDTQALQIVDHDRVGQPCIGAPQLRRHLRMGPGQAAYMDLVDDRVRVRDLRGPVPLPVEGRIYYDRTDRVWRAVRRARSQRGRGGTAPVSEQGVVIADRAVDRLGVGIKEQLVRIAHPTLDRIPRSVDPVAVALPEGNTKHIAVPDEPVHLGEGDPRFIPGRIEQAKFHRFGDLREEGKISAALVPCGAERRRHPRPDVHPPSRPEPESPQPDMSHLTEPDRSNRT